MNANALRLAPINTVITTANMATLGQKKKRSEQEAVWKRASKANQLNESAFTQSHAVWETETKRSRVEHNKGVGRCGAPCLAPINVMEVR